METKFWSLDAINRNGIFFRIGYNGTLADAKVYAGGLSTMYGRLKGKACGIIIYDADFEQILPRVSASVNCSNCSLELWAAAMIRERSADKEELAPIPDVIMVV